MTSVAPDLTAQLARASAIARLVSDDGAYVALSGSANAEARYGGRPSGPLERDLLAVKSMIAVHGLPQTVGSRSDGEPVPAHTDAPVVAHARRAGVVVVGVTAMHELAFGATGINDAVGTPRNPRDPDRVPGGSSSGSAVAVAEGSATLALGTDTGGSVRIPAACCAVVGFKPARGSYSLAGVVPLAPTLDHVGSFAASVPALARLHGVLGRRAERPYSPVRRLGLDVAAVDGADTAVRRAVERAVDVLTADGWRIDPVEMPPDGDVVETSTVIMFAEAAANHLDRLGEVGDDIADRLEHGRALPATAYIDALRHRQELTARLRRLLRVVDGVVGPTVPILPPTLVEARRPDIGTRLVRHTRLADVTGSAALTLPVPGDGPVGLQLQASGNQAALVTAAMIEEALRDAVT